MSGSSDPKKKSFSAGAPIAESSIQPGHLFLGTDKGAFWFTEDDGATWKERSKGMPNAYILSIVPSKYQKSRIYVTLAGINYDNLSNHVYVTEDGGKKWQNC